MADTLPLSWKIRRYLWDSMFILIYKGKKVLPIPVPVPTSPPLRVIRMSEREPTIAIPNIMVADRIPGDERSVKMLLAYALRRFLYKVYPANQPGLPGIDPDIEVALKQAFNDRYQALYPVPLRAAELWADGGQVDLGAMALNSPYACFLQRDGDRLVWDFTDLKDHSLHRDLISPACTVVFEPDPAKPGQVRAVEIDCVLGRVRPGDPDWPRARALAMCGASTQVSLVRHFNWVHLACGAHFAVATRNRLSPDHVICRLVWPHMYGTQNSNYLVTAGQMLPNGEFESIFSFTHDGMCKLFARTHYNYRISVIDPELDWEERGLAGSGLVSPVQQNLLGLHRVMHDHATAYIAAYYPDDAALRAEGQVINWLADMDRTIPNGIQRISGPITPEALTRAGLARLIAGLTYMAAVQHEALGSVMWNYQLWVDQNPVRVYKDGRRLPVDIYQRLLNANFNLNVRRAKLLQDFEYMGVDDKGKTLFRAFHDRLQALEDSYTARYQPERLADPDEPHDREKFPPWIILPSAIDANINA